MGWILGLYCLSMHLCDATWLGFIKSKEENNSSVKSICDIRLLEGGEDMFLLMPTCCGSLMVARFPLF